MEVVPSVARSLRRFKENGDARTPSGSPDHSKTYEVHMDAFDCAIWGVLMQEGHPIAFERRKLNDAERGLRPKKKR